MTNPHETPQTQIQLQDLVAQNQHLRETIIQEQEHLREIIAQQQAELQAMQARLAALEPARPAETVETAVGAATETSVEVDLAEGLAEPIPDASEARSTKTSRRRLLTTAGAAAAAATVATVALGSGEVAHAATGDNLVLGHNNDAGYTTALSPSSGTTPNPLLQVANAGNAGGIGVYGVGGSGGRGVDGYAPGASSSGVYGSTDTGYGVFGYSDSGAGVFGSAGSTGVAGVFLGGRAHLQLAPGSASGAPTSETHSAGELYLDSAATLWICVTTGTPGTWVKMAHLAPGATSGGAITYLAKPIRLLDTRSGQPALFTPGSPYAGGSTHAIQVAGDVYNSVTVPTSAVGAIGNVTVANPSGGGYLALVPHGAGFSGTAVLAFSAGQVVSNSFNVGLASGQLDIIVGGSGSMTTDVILDLFAVVD